MTGTTPSPSNPHDHSEYISSLHNTPRILRFQARLADAATNLRSLSQEDDEMFPEPYSPLSASSFDSTLDKMDHIVDEPLADNPFLSSSSSKQAAIKRRRSIKSTKAIETKLEPEESPTTNRHGSRSRRSSTVSSLTSLDEAPTFISYNSFDDRIASAAMNTPTQKRSIRNLNGFGSVSRAKRRKLKVKNVIDPKLWAHTQDSNEASVRVDIDEDQSPTFVPNKQKDNDTTKRRPRGHKRDSTRVIIGTPVPHRLHSQQRLYKPQDSLDVKLNRLRKHASAADLDLSSHNIVPDSLEEVLQSESLSIRTNSQRSLDSIDGDVSSFSQPLPLLHIDATFPTTEVAAEAEPKLGLVENQGPDSLADHAEPECAVKLSPRETECHSDDSISPSAEREPEQALKVEEAANEISTLVATESIPHAPIPQTILLAETPSEDTTDLHHGNVDEQSCKDEVADIKDEIEYISEPHINGNPQGEEDIYPGSDDELDSSDNHQDETNNQSSSYLRQLASSMSRFILG
jgi:hypothetical protein